MQGAERIQSEIRVGLSDKKKEIIVNNYKSVFRLLICNLISVLEFKCIELFLPRKKLESFHGYSLCRPAFLDPRYDYMYND